jgi:hypothetical protein
LEGSLETGYFGDVLDDFRGELDDELFIEALVFVDCC